MYLPLQQFIFEESDDVLQYEGDDIHMGARSGGRVMPMGSPANHPRRRAKGGTPAGSDDELEDSSDPTARTKRSLPALSRKGLVARGPVL